MDDTLVIPLSPPNKRSFLYNETHKHNSLNVKALATKTREIQLLQSSSPTRIPATLKSGDVDRSTPARRCPAQPLRRWHDEGGKCGSLTTQDISGAQSVHRNVQKRNKPDRMTFVNDIKGAWPDAHSRLSKRQVNPMAPIYALPSFVKAPSPTLSQARPINSTHGIDGAQPLVKYMKWKQRKSTFLANDVDGSQVPQMRLYKDRRSPLDVNDINNDPEGAGHVFHTNRTTNVLDPRYVWDVPPGVEAWTIGDIVGDKPATLMNAKDAPRRLHGQPMPSKETCAGSQSKLLHEVQLAKAKSGFEYLGQPRQEVRNINHIADIVGAEAASVRPGITTNRVTDPLKPDYIWPGLSADMGSAAYCRTPEPVSTPEIVDDAEVAPVAIRTKNHKELEESLKKVKAVFHERGAYAGRALARIVSTFDDGDGHIVKEELNNGLRAYLGFDMEAQDFDHVWSFFDKDGSGEISVAEFLHGIRGNLGKHRLNAVLEAFAKIDRDSTGQISINEIEALYDVSHHPKVVTGEWSRDDALHDFLKQWDADTNGEVSREEFLDYFKDVSLGMENDREFMDAMRDVFPTLAPSANEMLSSFADGASVGKISLCSPLPSPQRRSSAGSTPDVASLGSGRLARARRRLEQVGKEEQATVVPSYNKL